MALVREAAVVKMIENSVLCGLDWGISSAG